MSITLTLSPALAQRLAKIADREVQAIGSKLATAGASGLAAAMVELREAMELITRLEAAGILPKAIPAAPAIGPLGAGIVIEPKRAPDADRDPADEAPPAAVVAARASKPAPVLRGARIDGSYSGPG